MERKTILLLNESISYLTDEKLEKNIVLFIHGFGDSSKRAVSLFNLKPRDYSIIAIDLPGCGSSSNNNKISLQLYCDIVKDFIKELLPNKKIYIVSHSLGAIPALYVSKNNPNIKHIFGVTPLLPLLLDNDEVNTLKSFLLPKNNEELYFAQSKLFSEFDNEWINRKEVKRLIMAASEEFLANKNKIFTNLVDEIFSSYFVSDLYDEFFKTNSNITLIISKHDNLINYKKALKVIKKYKIVYLEFNEFGHAMFYKGSNKIHEFITNFINRNSN